MLQRREAVPDKREAIVPCSWATSTIDQNVSWHADRYVENPCLVFVQHTPKAKHRQPGGDWRRVYCHLGTYGRAHRKHGQLCSIVDMNARHVSQVLQGAACDMFAACEPAYLMTQLVGRRGFPCRRCDDPLHRSLNHAGGVTSHQLTRATRFWAPQQ